MRYRNTLRNSINTAKKTYYHNLFETASDMKTTWRRINSLLHPNRSNPQLKLKVNDDIITDSSTIASKFNTHFAEVAPSLDANIPRLSDDPVANTQAVSNSFVFYNTIAEEVYKIILSFKSKGSLLNEVPTFIYKKVSDLIAPILPDLITEAVHQDFYPDFLKAARVTPIHESGSKSGLEKPGFFIKKNPTH